MPLKDFYQAAQKNFSVVIYEDNVIQDISDDICSVAFKTDFTDDTTVALTSNADVTSSGSAGIAIFELDESDTDMEIGTYYYELKWEVSSSGETHILEQNQVTILDRVN